MGTTSLERRAIAAEKYKPERIRLLLVAEKPPASKPSEPDRYFYFDSPPPTASGKLKADFLIIGVAQALFGIVPTHTTKPQVLRQLQQSGVSLIDMNPDPADTRGDIVFVPGLVARCREMLPDKIILIKANVYDAAFEALQAAGLPVVNQRCAFPSSGRQPDFARHFALALKASGLFFAVGKDSQPQDLK